MIEITAYIPKIAAGTYNAVCTGVTIETSKVDGSKFRKWEFTLADGSGRTINATSSLQTTPRSKGGKWIAAMIGHEPQVGEQVEVVGKPVLIGVYINDDGYEKIESILPPMATPTTPRPAAELAEATEKAAKIHAAQEGDDALPF